MTTPSGGFEPLPPSDTPSTPAVPGNTTGPLAKVSTTLALLNILVPQFATLAASSILVGKMLIPLFKKNGIPIGTFEQEIDKLDADLNTFQSAIDAFNTAHPESQPATPPETGTTPPL